MSQPPSKSRLDTALELFVYAPLGVTLYLRDAYPMIRAMLVNRGRTEVEQRSSQMSGTLTSWKHAGASALAHLPIPGRARPGDDPAPPSAAPARRPATAAPPPSPPVGPPGAARPAPYPNGNGATAHGSAASPAPAAPGAAELPIPGYDELSASQVVERLAGLAPAELEIVRRYELAGRGRKTILGRIEQLAS
ncbi:MAG: hypothetical protein U0V73_09755 [Acidimicrobiia bacterium]